MRIALILAPYDTARRGWRSGDGPGDPLRSGRVPHLEAHGQDVASTTVVEDDPGAPPVEIRTAAFAALAACVAEGP